ncbi:MAG: M56 family metallopeptidase [Bacteroidaceae bacterium]|nr:M56 family metallopeptidase [Bacteroidaceae bacterium]
MNYIIIQGITLALLVAVYELTLSRTTLHGFNRCILLVIMALSAVLPLIRVTLPEKQADAIPAPVSEYLMAPFEYIMPENIADANPVDAVAPVVPVTETEYTPARKINWSGIIAAIWLAGAAVFLLRLLLGVARAESVSRRSPRTLSDGVRLVLSDSDCQPTSWRHTIIMSRRDYEENGQQIIAHEQAHIHCHHSHDVLLASLLCSVQWLNPAAWMLKRSLKQIHEYEADAAVLREGYDGHQYQVFLIHAALERRVCCVTSNFADCSTKKRIDMMNRNQSSPWVRMRVLFLLPVTLLAIALASASKPNARQTSMEEPQILENSIESTIETASTQSELLDTAAFLDKYGLSEDFKLKELNKFVYVQTDGSIFITVDGQHSFYNVPLSNFETEFGKRTNGADYQWVNPEMVFVTYCNPAHLEVCVDLVEILEKSYTTDNIRVFKDSLFRQFAPTPSMTPEYGYNVNKEKDKYVNIDIDGNNRITLTAWNGCSPDGNGSIVPETKRTLSTVDEVKNMLDKLFPNQNEKVLYAFTPDINSSTRLKEPIAALLRNSRYVRAPYNRGPANMTHKDSIDYIILGKYGSPSGRIRHVKDMKWYNENKDKDNFFRMGFIGGKLCVCKGNDASKLAPIAFDQLVPYFKENCPDGNERNAIVLFELPKDESVPVEYLDKILTKMEGWITTFTKRLYLSPTHIE